MRQCSAPRGTGAVRNVRDLAWTAAEQLVPIVLRTVWWAAPRYAAYRVRARDARIRVMRRITPTRTCKNEVVEPHTIAIITRYFGGLFYRPTRRYSVIQINYIELLFSCCRWCECEVLGEAWQQHYYFAQLQHYDSASSLVLQTIKPCAYLFRAIIQLF